MAIRFIDSVTTYGKEQLLERYDGVQSPMRVQYRNWSPKGITEATIEPGCAGAGRFHSAAIYFSGSFGGFVEKQLLPSNSDLHMLSFNLLYRSPETSPKFSQTDGTREGVLASMIPGISPTNRTTLTLTMNDSGGFRVYLGGHVSLIRGNFIVSGGKAEIDVWTQITVELKIGVTDGYVKIWQESPVEINPMDLVADSGLINTSQHLYDLNNPVSSFRLSQPGNFQGRFDEIYVQDGLTSSNNAFLGRVHIKEQNNGYKASSSDFVDFGGIQNGHPGPTLPEEGLLQIIDDKRIGNRGCRMQPDETLGAHTGDKSYLEGTVSGDRLVVNGPGGEGVLAIQSSINSRKTSADTTQYEFLADVSGQEHLAGFESLSTTYKVRSHVYNSDPRDNSQWTESKIQEFDFGIKKV